MDHLLGALGQELEAYEAEEGSASDNGQVSGTEQGKSHAGAAIAFGSRRVFLCMLVQGLMTLPALPCLVFT